METLYRKEQILHAFKEGKTIQSRDGNGWKDFIRQNQLDTPNLDYGGIDNWRIKPEPIQSDQTQIEKLEAEKAELLNMLEFSLNRLKNTTEFEVVDFYKDDCAKIESLIQKHKQ